MKALETMVVAPALTFAGAGSEARSQPEVQSLVGAYAAAWESRDPVRIASLHSADTEFDLRVDGEVPARGRAAVRERFAGILRDNPSYASTIRKIDFGPNFVVIEYAISMDPPAPFRLGRMRDVPTGKPYQVSALDVIRFRDGLVSEKVTFLDADTIRAKSAAAKSEENAR